MNIHLSCSSGSLQEPNKGLGLGLGFRARVLGLGLGLGLADGAMKLGVRRDRKSTNNKKMDCTGI